MEKHITIAMVLRSGGIYDDKYVNNLANSIHKNVSIPHHIVCLTDMPNNLEVDEVRPFKHNWPAWWGKIELFRPNMFEDQVFYIDLDTFIIKNIDNILEYTGQFCGLRDFYNLEELASGILSWHESPLTTNIYNEFIKNPEHFMELYRIGGDQAFIRRKIKQYDFFQDLYPNEVVSYKVHCLKGNESNVPSNAKIICFHGNPKPHVITNKVSEFWTQ